MRSIISSSLLLLILYVATTLGGCARIPTWAEETILDITGPVEVEVESFAGDIRITADSRLDHARVQVIRQAVHGVGRLEYAERSLEDIEVSIEIVPGELGQKLRVIASTTHPEPQFQRAHLFITLPEAEGIRIRTDMGDITAMSVSGPLDIRGSGGDIRVQTNRPLLQPVIIINNGGHIEYRIRGESTARFDCEAIRGYVYPWIRFGRFQIDPKSTDRILRATLNGGENRVILRTVDGDICISVVHNPELVHWFNLDR